jgi:hypothetical protein
MQYASESMSSRQNAEMTRDELERLDKREGSISRRTARHDTTRLAFLLYRPRLQPTFIDLKQVDGDIVKWLRQLLRI